MRCWRHAQLQASAEQAVMRNSQLQAHFGLMLFLSDWKLHTRHQGGLRAAARASEEHDLEVGKLLGLVGKLEMKLAATQRKEEQAVKMARRAREREMMMDTANRLQIQEDKHHLACQQQHISVLQHAVLVLQDELQALQHLAFEALEAAQELREHHAEMLCAPKGDGHTVHHAPEGDENCVPQAVCQQQAHVCAQSTGRQHTVDAAKCRACCAVSTSLSRAQSVWQVQQMVACWRHWRLLILTQSAAVLLVTRRRSELRRCLEYWRHTPSASRQPPAYLLPRSQLIVTKHTGEEKFEATPAQCNRCKATMAEAGQDRSGLPHQRHQQSPHKSTHQQSPHTFQTPSRNAGTTQGDDKSNARSCGSVYVHQDERKRKYKGDPYMTQMYLSHLALARARSGHWNHCSTCAHLQHSTAATCAVSVSSNVAGAATQQREQGLLSQRFAQCQPHSCPHDSKKSPRMAKFRTLLANFHQTCAESCPCMPHVQQQVHVSSPWCVAGQDVVCQPLVQEHDTLLLVKESHDLVEEVDQQRVVTAHVASLQSLLLQESTEQTPEVAKQVLGARRRRGFSPEPPRDTWSRPNPGDMSFFSVIFFSKFDLQLPQVGLKVHLRQWA